MGPRLDSGRFKCFSREDILTRSRPSHDANLLLRFDGEGHFLQDQGEIFLVPHLCILKGDLSFLRPVRGGRLVLNSGRCFQGKSLGRQKWLVQTDYRFWGSCKALSQRSKTRTPVATTQRKLPLCSLAVKESPGSECSSPVN